MIQAVDPQSRFDRHVSILGVNITDVTVPRAVDIIERMIVEESHRAHSIYFVNAHTLNLAAADKEYRDVLNGADHVFGDGTGVRWAARLQGIRVQDNLVGTDLTPSLFQLTAGRGYSYFMLGSDERTVEQSAEYARHMFPGWKQAGFHHGFLKSEEVNNAAIKQINAAKPDVLLVGMGNPIQERWVKRNLERLHVPAVLAIGGLFDYWAGNVSRAPQWLRSMGHEWLWRLYQQPADKARRYLYGNPLFLYSVFRERLGSKQKSRNRSLERV